MITAAVCDDEEGILDYMSEKIKAELGRLNAETELFSASDPFVLLERVKTEPPDVLFLDIDMPKLGGMDIARYITENNIGTLLVFVTSHDALVYESFQYRPFAFVRKSCFDNEIGAVLERLTAELQKSGDSFSFKTGSGLFRIKLCDILYFESDGNYIELHSTDDTYKFRGTIASVESELTGKSFIRIHKGFIVNLSHVFALRGDDLKLDSGDILPIGRSNKETIKRALMRYMR